MDSDSVPSELITDVLSRLPPKSIAKFHCVSERWASLFGGAHFTELFLTRRSSAQPPRILFAVEKHGLWNIFSMPQRLRPYEEPSSSPSPSSSPVASAEFHMSFPPDNMRIYPLSSRRFSFGYASGLMYFYGMWVKEEDYYGLPVVCNPNTGRYETLPFLVRYRTTSSFFGFDPVGKQYKVLFVAYPSGPDRHKVITLGSGETKWRTIKCPLMHENASDGICINGVVYYLGDLDREMTDFVIVCFHVRSETFEFIYPEGCCQLINYLGKLGLVFYDGYDGDGVEFRVWVLEDLEKREWSKYEYSLRDEKFLARYVSVVGVTVTGEIVLSMADYTAKQPFYVFYFNPERKSLQCVEIKGFGEYYDALACNVSRVHVFVEDVVDSMPLQTRLRILMLRSGSYSSQASMFHMCRQKNLIMNVMKNLIMKIKAKIKDKEKEKEKEMEMEENEMEMEMEMEIKMKKKKKEIGESNGHVIMCSYVCVYAL